MTNGERANMLAEPALEAFAKSGGGSFDDPATMVADLVSDLGHYLQTQQGLSRAKTLRWLAHAIGMYNAEARARDGEPYQNDCVTLQIQQYHPRTAKPGAFVVASNKTTLVGS